MRRRLLARLSFTTSVLAAFVSAMASTAEKLDKIPESIRLEDGFAHPPLAARPRAYWTWMNGNVSLPQMTAELEEMKDKGLGGLDIFDVGAVDPQKVIPAGPAFMGPESVKAIGHSVREAGRLGLEMGLITSSSWNAGGPWVTPEYGAMGIFYSLTTAQGPSRFEQELPFPQVPKTSPKDPHGLPVYYKEIAALAIPRMENKTIADFQSVIDLSGCLHRGGRLSWDIPPGEWEILRLVCAGTGERLVLPSPNSGGLIIDHFNPAATEMHFQYLIDKLQEELGDLRKTALKLLYLPSYEVTSYEKEKGWVWTPALREEFKRRRGYDLAVYLPLLFGYTSRDNEVAQRFFFDFNLTLSDLIIEYHYQKAREMCQEAGLLLCSEAGGPGQPLHNCPFEALRSLGALDIPRGEFWYKHQRLDETGTDLLWLVKEIACASHIYGKPIVDGESFTSFQHWQVGPFELKLLADRAMGEGLNRFTFHTSAHNPPAAGKPGWVYHAGTHINTNCTWWPQIKPFIDYLSRCSFLLQQGLFVGDVCWYYGDQAPNFVKPKHTDPSLGAGYDYDVANTEVILSRMEVKEHRIVLPDGMSYELLVLPERDDINLEVLRKLERLVQQGATIVGPKPNRSHGLQDYRLRDEAVRELAGRMWGPCDGVTVKEQEYGQGKIIWGRNLREILIERGVGPDFTFTSEDRGCDLDYIHRRTADADIYFVSNKTLNRVIADCTFRVFGKAPELWQPDTGGIIKPAIYQAVREGTKIPLNFPPAGSLFLLFRETSADQYVVSATPRIPAGQTRMTGNDMEVHFRQQGHYTFQTNRGKTIALEIENIPGSIEIAGPWEVHFPPGWGAPDQKVFPELISWTEAHEEGIKYFSGTAVYHKKFILPENLLSNDIQLCLDLGTVKDMADAYLNGIHLGIKWTPPFQWDITRAVKSGENLLVVEITNQWSNRLVGDALQQNGRKYTHTNILYSIMWEQPWEKTPLLISGLLGPVHIRAQQIIHVNLQP